jgi:DNA polymerase I-like protein with 3'-5' exonuclease and polymerase domains
MRDIQRAVYIAQGRDHSFTIGAYEKFLEGDRTLQYDTHPSYDRARQFVSYLRDNPQLPVAYDLETAETADLDEDAREQFADTYIKTIQFSHTQGTGICLPWANGYRQIASDIMQLPNPKVGHNSWLFDLKVLKAVEEREGFQLVPRDLGHDTLQMFHHWQPDLPAHLQYAASFVQFPFPWKHLSGTNLEFYGIADVDATLRIFYEAQKTMKARGIWEGYAQSVYEVRPVLADMERRGFPVSDERRLKLDGEFDLAQQELDAEIQKAIPDELRPIEPRRGKKGSYSYGYIHPPKDTTGLVLRTFKEIGLDASGEPAMVDVERWCRLLPFNANSPDQLKAYIRYKGYKMPKSIKDEDANGNPKDTTEKKQLQRLAQQHHDEFFRLVIEYKELGKARGTYIEGFKPWHDKRVHTTFTFDTGIGQLSSRNPNIQNFPKHGRSEAQKRVVKALRGMIAAEPGMLLSEWDFKSCHVLTLGFLAESANYIRLARLDMHSFVAGHFLKCWDGPSILKESDDELKARFKWLKSDPYRKHVRDDQAKHAILGIGNGLKGPGLYKRYPENFDNQKHACQFLDIIEFLFPEVFEWQRNVQKLAHDQTYLKTQFGHIRWFYDVFQWNSKMRKWMGGDQAEEAISFWLSNIAFGHIREKMKMLAAAGLDEKYGLCNNVHDSFVFHFDERLLEEHKREVYPILVSPSTVLKHPTIAPDGLWIGVECAVGKDWANMDEVNVVPKAEAVTV